MASNPGVHILLTRPIRQSVEYAKQLEALFGPKIQVQVAPLLKIVPGTSLPDFSDIKGILFTSLNAVEAFSSLTADRSLPALCVGDRTMRAAIENGFIADSAGGDVSDLTELARTKWGGTGGLLLYPRGEHVAGDIGRDLSRAGLAVRQLVVYRQEKDKLDPSARKLIELQTQLLLPLFSPRTAELFLAETARLDLGNICAICISPNVAKLLTHAGFAEVRVAPEPNAAAVTQEIATYL